MYRYTYVYIVYTAAVSQNTTRLEKVKYEKMYIKLKPWNFWVVAHIIQSQIFPTFATIILL